jgi:hypothetical protein
VEHVADILRDIDRQQARRLGGCHE